MVAISVVVLLVLLVALTGLAYVVHGLRGQVQTLSEQLAQAISPGRPAAPEQAAPPVAAPPRPDPVASDEPVPVITRLAAEPPDDLDLTTARIASVTLARPLIKVAAVAHGVRRALGEEQRMRVRHTMHRELRRQRKTRRRRRAAQASPQGWRP